MGARSPTCHCRSVSPPTQWCPRWSHPVAAIYLALPVYVYRCTCIVLHTQNTWKKIELSAHTWYNKHIFVWLWRSAVGLFKHMRVLWHTAVRGQAELTRRVQKSLQHATSVDAVVLTDRCVHGRPAWGQNRRRYRGKEKISLHYSSDASLFAC
jgi:hypothetical protein